MRGVLPASRPGCFGVPPVFRPRHQSLCPSLRSADSAPPGNGLLLFFRVDDFDLALERARALVTRLDEEPHVNPNTQTREVSLRDPDGYVVSISALL